MYIRLTAYSSFAARMEACSGDGNEGKMKMGLDTVTGSGSGKAVAAEAEQSLEKLPNEVI